MQGANCQFSDQKKLLFPPNETADKGKLDIVLYTKIIKENVPHKYDDMVNKLRAIRNRDFPWGRKSLSYKEFDNLWHETEILLQTHDFNIHLVSDLKTRNLSSFQLFKAHIKGKICNLFLLQLLMSYLQVAKYVFWNLLIWMR